MGLSITGEFTAAERAYDWLASEQLDDGSWWASYVNGTPANVTRRETNYVAYIATGVWHHYLISEDRAFLGDGNRSEPAVYHGGCFGAEAFERDAEPFEVGGAV